MGKVLMSGGGGSVDLDVITAEANDILDGKIIVDAEGEPLEGTMTNRNVVDDTIGGVNSNYPSIAVHKGDNIQIGTTTVSGESLVALRVPDGYYDGHNYVGTDASDLGNATTSQVLSVATFSSANGINAPGAIASMAGGTKTPTTSSQTISCSGKYMTSNIVIPAFSLPSASIIKKGAKYTLYGKTVTGTWEGYVTSPLYLYRNGTWSNLQTSGISKVAGYRLDVETAQLQFWASANSYDYTLGRLNSSIDLTNYNYIKVYTAGLETSGTYANVYAGADTSSSITSISSCDAYKSINNPKEQYLILNVSSLTGNHYIYLQYKYSGNGDFGTNYANITQLFLSAT